MQLIGFIDDTIAESVMKKINMTAFFRGGFNTKDGACSKSAGKKSVAACTEKAGMVGTTTSINNIRELSSGEKPPLFLWSFQVEVPGLCRVLAKDFPAYFG